MNTPFTKQKDPTAEEKIEEKVNKLADDAKTFEELDKVQRLIKNQEEIKNCHKKTVLGIEPKDWFLGAVSMAQIIAILKVEDFKVITSKALNFVHKGRLR